jgi:3-isopropylmalate/(R)-2-methylmalate dehydratase large subunit
MTLCNMSIEAGARAGMIAPDETTFAYLEGRRFAPKGDAWEKAGRYWRTLPSDEGAEFDREFVEIDARARAHVTWGTSPGMVVPVTRPRPDPAEAATPPIDKLRARARLHGLTPGTRIEDIASIASSSARAPTRASKTCAPPRAS